MFELPFSSMQNGLFGSSALLTSSLPPLSLIAQYRSTILSNGAIGSPSDFITLSILSLPVWFMIVGAAPLRDFTDIPIWFTKTSALSNAEALPALIFLQMKTIIFGLCSLHFRLISGTPYSLSLSPTEYTTSVLLPIGTGSFFSLQSMRNSLTRYSSSSPWFTFTSLISSLYFVSNCSLKPYS